MVVPSRLQSVAEVVVDCRWWKIVHIKLPYRYNGTKYITSWACTAIKECEYKNGDLMTGGCAICGNVAKIPVGERP